MCHIGRRYMKVKYMRSYCQLLYPCTCLATEWSTSACHCAHIFAQTTTPGLWTYRTGSRKRTGALNCQA